VQGCASAHDHDDHRARQHDRDLIDAAVAKGAQGIVVAGVGDGNMTTPVLEALPHE